MVATELQKLVSKGESDDLEFKKSTGQRTSALRTLCGMLNGKGGIVLFGVADNGTIKGQQVTAKTMEDISIEFGKVEPPAFPDIELVPVEGEKQVIMVRVSGGGGPYTYDARAYVREGPVTRQMPQPLFERLLLEKMHAAHRWENQPAIGLTIDDLDNHEIIRTVEEAIRRQRLEDPGTRDPWELLLGMGLIKEGKLLNAAAVLFTRTDRILPNYPQCLLRLARFRGTDKTEFIDNRQEYGNAFELFVRAQRFLRDHLPVAGRIVPNLFERVDDPLYPPAALREALANAICHRDYSAGGGAISIAIYDDRLEIASTGLLPFDITPEILKHPHPSRPWNPLIANVFYRRGIIESWGRGTLKMAELTAQAGLEPPEIECYAGEVVVRFRPNRYVPPSMVKQNVSPLQQQILQIISEVGPTSIGTLMEHLAVGLPRRTVQNNLQMLKHMRLIDMEGQKRGVKWYLL